MKVKPIAGVTESAIALSAELVAIDGIYTSLWRVQSGIH